jgi:2'-5' RNA ligase
MRFWVGVILPKKISKGMLKIQKKIAKKYKTYHSLESKIGPHFTITYQENVNERNLKKIEKVVNEISKEIKSFKVEIKGIRRFYKLRVICAKVLKSKELNSLSKKLSYRLSKFEKIRRLRPFTPHITLADKDITKENFKEAFKEFKNKKIFYEFELNKIYIGKATTGGRIKVFKSFKLKFK